MKSYYNIVAGFLLLSFAAAAQPQLFKENARWGVKENEKNIVAPVYDTIFNFDPSGRLCLACFKSAGTSASKFIKVYTISYSCRYFNRSGQPLAVKAAGNDTCTIFALSKHTVKQMSESPDFFVVSVKNKKNVVDKDFKQITFKGYHEINFTAEPSFLVVQTNEANTVLTGLINLKEELVVPFQYSEITVNTNDSLIIACSAGIRANSEDDVYNYEGKKLGTYRKHVEMATKNFVIHKLYEPKEYYLVTNLATKEEKPLQADELQFYDHDEVLIRIKNDWFVYDLTTGQKKPKPNSTNNEKNQSGH